MKKLIKPALLILGLPLLCSCAGGVRYFDKNMVQFASVQNFTSTSIYYSSTKTNGTRTYTINVKESNSKLEIYGYINFKGGAIDMTISFGEEHLLENTYTETSEISVVLKEYGTYKIKLVHTNYNGSYSLKWTK